jgi:hypothetical protein
MPDVLAAVPNKCPDNVAGHEPLTCGGAEIEFELPWVDPACVRVSPHEGYQHTTVSICLHCRALYAKSAEGTVL